MNMIDVVSGVRSELDARMSVWISIPTHAARARCLDACADMARFIDGIQGYNGGVRLTLNYFADGSSVASSTVTVFENKIVLCYSYKNMWGIGVSTYPCTREGYEAAVARARKIRDNESKSGPAKRLTDYIFKRNGVTKRYV